MGRWRNHRQGHWIALVAAYVLLAQSLFAAFAIGASARPLIDDPTGAILCSTLDARPAPDGTPLPTGHPLPDCCLTGCMMFGHAVLPAPVAASLTLGRAGLSADAIAPRAIHHAPPRRGTPLHPRAPPATS